MRVTSLPFNPSSALHNSTEKLLFHRRISDRGGVTNEGRVRKGRYNGEGSDSTGFGASEGPIGSDPSIYGPNLVCLNDFNRYK